MGLTRTFKQTVRARVQRDGRYREALFTEAINACLAGDTASGKAMLRDLVNATIGFRRRIQAQNARNLLRLPRARTRLTRGIPPHTGDQ